MDDLRGIETFFKILPYIFAAVFILFFTGIVIAIAKNISRLKANMKTHALTVSAVVISKRIGTEEDGASMEGARPDETAHGSVESAHASGLEYFYVTFQTESGERMEFRVRGDEYDMLTEGSRGRLTFQGLEYRSFKKAD